MKGLFRGIKKWDGTYLDVIIFPEEILLEHFRILSEQVLKNERYEFSNIGTMETTQDIFLALCILRVYNMVHDVIKDRLRCLKFM